MRAPGADGRSESEVAKGLAAAALRLFSSQGFEGTSVQQLCEEAGVSKGAFYYYFDSKDEVLYELYAGRLRVEMELLESILASDLPTQGKVERLAHDVVISSIENRDLVLIYWRSQHQLRPETRALVQEERRRYTHLLYELISVAQAENVIRSDVPADVIGGYYLGAVQHLVHWYRRQDRREAEQLAASWADMLMYGLRPR